MTKKEDKKAKKGSDKKETKAFSSKGKTELVLQMVEKGKNRSEILDKLCEMDESISRKSNAGLVSHIFKANDLLGQVESGSRIGQAKKTITIKTKDGKKIKSSDKDSKKDSKKESKPKKEPKPKKEEVDESEEF